MAAIFFQTLNIPFHFLLTCHHFCNNHLQIIFAPLKALCLFLWPLWKIPLLYLVFSNFNIIDLDVIYFVFILPVVWRDSLICRSVSFVTFGKFSCNTSLHNGSAHSLFLSWNSKYTYVSYCSCTLFCTFYPFILFFSLNIFYWTSPQVS